ncbi:hypothetical protein K525DRAFT_183744 [Schizophyllum commune Loenen D]|nr:hypothetical protein K525DRAFT_183744 [Schizophyllum commune Loenen D]
MAPIQKPHPPTTPGAIYYTHGYTIGDEEIALLQTIMAVQKKAVEYLDSNEPNSDPRLRLVASRVAQWLPESIEHEAETPKAAVRRIAIELDDLWYNHRDTMEKLTKGDEELDPKALERAMRPREEAEAAHKAPLFDVTVKRDGQEISLDNGPIVIGPGSSKVVFTCKRRRAPPAQPTANATTAAPRVAAADQAKASSHAAPTTTTDPAATEPISAGSNATSAAPRSKTPASRRAADKDKDAAEDTDNPNIPTPIPKATPEKRRKPSSRIEKAQIPALDLSGGAAEEEAPAPAEAKDDAAEDGAAGDDAPELAPVAGPSKPRRASPRKAASSKASEPKPAAKPAKAKAAAKAAATKAAATKAATTKAAAKKPVASKAAATKPTTSKAASKKSVASRAPTPEAPEPQEAVAGPSKPSAYKRKRTEEVEEESADAEDARPTKGRKATKAQTTVEPARRSARTRAPVQRD